MCADLVQVSWPLQREETVNLEDISPSGCRLLMEHAIPQETIIQLRCGGQAFQGVVRYCRRSDIGFDIGVQFTEAGAWVRQEFEPKHLLEIPSFRIAEAKS